VIPICNRNFQNTNIVQNQTQDKLKDQIAIQSSDQNQYQNAEQDQNQNKSTNKSSEQDINTEEKFLRSSLNVDTQILLAKNLLNIVIQSKKKLIQNIDKDFVQNNSVYLDTQRSIDEIKKSYEKISKYLDLINNNAYADENYSLSKQNNKIINIVYNKVVEEIEQQASIVSKSQNILGYTNNKDLFDQVSFLQNLESKLLSLPSAIPIDVVRITSRYGSRIDPKTQIPSFHRGIDLVGEKNQKIIATSNGVVIAAGPFSGYGNYIEISHGNGIKTGYAHLNKVLVKIGDRVRDGDIIGIQGSTGKSTGDHLHFEVKVHNNDRDPLQFITINPSL
jgi:murein DD-endopeptidase MepM/ murein hydrolase activator NlpD